MSSQPALPDLLTSLEVHAAVAVVAHPDDESFGLGAVLAGLVQRGVQVRVVCLTHGEVSTLGGSADRGELRTSELNDAAAVLGVSMVTLLDHPDGQLSDVPDSILDAAVTVQVERADVVVVFAASGVTGHPDHQAATAAAIRAARRLGVPVLEWGVTPTVAARLNSEFGTAFVGLDGVDIAVDRAVQLAAIACHRSQSSDNPVMRRRLSLQGPYERVRLVVPAEAEGDGSNVMAGRSPLPPGVHEGVQ